MFVWAGAPESLNTYLDMARKFEGQVALQAQHMAKKSEEEEVYDIGDSLIQKVGNTAVLRIQGSLVNAHEWWHDFMPGYVTSYDAIKSAVSTLATDPEVSRVVVHFDSPGGMVKGVDTTARTLKTLASIKPTVGQAAMACSAGYWLASTMPQLFAENMAYVGNIGTMAAYPDYSELLAKEGIKFHLFTAGKEKGDGFSYTAFSEEEKSRIQSSVEKSNNFFLTTVSKNRNLMLSDRESWGEAQTFFAGEAKTVGLIDGVATLEEVVGSLMAAEPTYNGDNGMTISAEKMAAIAAGAAPETVLTTAELAFYQAQLETEESEVEDPETTAEGEDTEQEAEGEEAETEGEYPEVEATKVGAEHLSLAKELGKVEAKLEATEAALQIKEEAVASMKAQMEGLLVVAQSAVTNLQTALQLPKEAKGTTAEVIAQFNDLQDKMKARFPVGRRSSPAGDTAEPSVAAATFHPFRPV